MYVRFIFQDTLDSLAEIGAVLIWVFGDGYVVVTVVGFDIVA